MSMRISTLMLHRQGVDQMLRQQANLAQTQREVATGQRLHTASAAPAQWSAAERLDRTLSSIQTYEANAGRVLERLGMEETALADAGDLLMRARELAVQANSAALDAGSRALIASELRAVREQMINVANTQGGDGRYLFAGSRDAVPPFAAGASVSYGGDAQARLVPLSSHQQMADGDTGETVFRNLRGGDGHVLIAADAANTGSSAALRARLVDASAWDAGSYTLSFVDGGYELHDAGNSLVQSGTYAPGETLSLRGVQLAFSGTPASGDRYSLGPAPQQDIFTTLQNLAEAVENPGLSAAARARAQTAHFTALQALEGAQAHLTDVQGSVGARLGSLERVQDSLSAQRLLAESHLSELRDLDYAEASSRLSLQQTLLQAAQLSFQRVQGLSLFAFLR